MKIKYLGTAAAEGWPALFCECQTCQKARELMGKNIRTRSQVLIDESLLIDFPPDVYMHVLKEKLHLSAVKSLLITHSHQDHFYPYDLILRGQPYGNSQIADRLDIYGNDAVQVLYNRAVLEENDTSNLFDIEQYHKIHAGKEFDIADRYHITALAADHKMNEDCLLYLIEKEGKCIFYANDTGWFPKTTWEQLEEKHLDLVSMDCTFGKGFCERNHMGLQNNRLVQKKLQQMGCVDEKTRFVITHFSHNAGSSHEELEAEAKKDSFLVAYDGFELEI